MTDSEEAVVNAAYQEGAAVAAAAGWPYPGDSPLARARRVAQAYRARYADNDPEGCAQLDALLTSWGQAWIAPTVENHDLDDWVGPAEAADLAAVDPATLRVWRSRGRLHGRPHGRSWEYRVRDVLALVSTVRHRARKASP